MTDIEGWQQLARLDRVLADLRHEVLRALPRTGGRIPTLIVSERHGHQGKATRRLVIREYDDDVALHGERP